MIFGLEITFQKSFQVVSNGVLLNTIPKGDNLTWCYQMDKPMSSYLLMLAIGHFNAEKSVASSGVPLEFYYEKEDSSRIEPTYRYSKKTFDFLEKKISATEWAYVNIDKNTIIIDKGDASTGQYILANALFNSTTDEYEYRVGIPMLSTGEYRLSFDSDPSNNMIQLRSNSINNNLFLNIDTTSSTIDGTGFYYFSVL